MSPLHPQLGNYQAIESVVLTKTEALELSDSVDVLRVLR